jgi:hypothetical protein
VRVSSSRSCCEGQRAKSSGFCCKAAAQRHTYSAPVASSSAKNSCCASCSLVGSLPSNTLRPVMVTRAMSVVLLRQEAQASGLQKRGCPSAALRHITGSR